MKRKITLLLVICMCFALSGCNLWMDGSYYSIQPHQDDHTEQIIESAIASSYDELRNLLIDMVEGGQQNGIISMPGFQEAQLTSYMKRAIAFILYSHPIGAYAVDEIQYDIGTSSGKPALAVDISYIHNRSEILRIRKAADMQIAENMIEDALESCEAGIVVRIAAYEAVDFALLVQNYVEAHPDTCMETPQVTATAYPQTGSDRVLELTFTYQTNRDALRNMQIYVGPVFEAAELNVKGEETQETKFALMYAFLMERSDYELETSITPAYSLLRHGVGDCKAFATVYAAMCRRAGLDCQVVTGTKEGAPWAWNIICIDGIYYHIDLLDPSNGGKLQTLTEAALQSYVWDYSSYPASGSEITQEQ